jgi:peptidyl-prolyl cis-trans isomerase SurA
MSTSTPTTHLRRPIVIGLVAVSVFVAACNATPSTPPPAPVSADTWAVVEGRELTKDAVDKAYRRSRDPQPLSDEETMAAKLALLNELILQELLMMKAGSLKIEVPDAELDTAFNNAKKNITDEAFQQELTARGVTAADMREGLRRELLTQKVIAQEVGAKIVISDQDVSDFYTANRANFNVPEEAYHLAQIVVTPVREPRIANATGDDAATPQAAEAKVRMLMDRLKTGAAFGDLAAGYSEDPESAPRGGDMGLIPISRLQQAPPQLRDVVIGKAPGSVNVATAGGAYTLVLVVAHEQAGQRDLSTPGVRQAITDTLRNRKEQLLRAAYLTALRSDAKVVNYLARQLVAAQSKPPALQPAAPGSK